MKKLIALLLMPALLALPSLALAQQPPNSVKHRNGIKTIGAVSTVVFTMTAPAPAGARLITDCSSNTGTVINRTPGTVVYITFNNDSVTAVATDATPNQFKLDDLSPAVELGIFGSKQLKAISTTSTDIEWAITCY